MYKSFIRADLKIKNFWSQLLKPYYALSLATSETCPSFNIKYIFHYSSMTC